VCVFSFDGDSCCFWSGPAWPATSWLRNLNRRSTPSLRRTTRPSFQPQKKKTHRRPSRAHAAGKDRVKIGEDVIVGPGEVVTQLVVMGGNATVDGTVDGNLVVLSGTAKVNGQVNEDLVTILVPQCSARRHRSPTMWSWWAGI